MFSPFAGQVGRFRRDQHANIAVIFAIAPLPILAAIGGAVDYSIANSQRAKIQAALDSAILAGAIAGKQPLDAGAGQSTAIAAANSAAASFFGGDTAGYAASLTTNYTMSGLNLSGPLSRTGSGQHRRRGGHTFRRPHR